MKCAKTIEYIECAYTFVDSGKCLFVSPVQILVVSRVDGGFANKWHIAMYEDAKVVCSVLEVGPRHCRYVRCPTYRGGSRDAVRIAP